HSYPHDPRSPNRNGLPRPDPPPEIPQGPAPLSLIGTLSHYHPLDRSTKWLCQGTFGTWLIIREMWRARHVSAWQRSGGQVIVAASSRRALTESLRGTGRTHK